MKSILTVLFIGSAVSATSFANQNLAPGQAIVVCAKANSALEATYNLNRLLLAQPDQIVYGDTIV